MSRSINTMPLHVQRRIREPWREESGFPGAFGGAWRGVKYLAKQMNRQERRRSKQVMLVADPDDWAWGQHRHRAQWDLY